MLDSERVQRIEELLLTLSHRSPQNRTRLLEQVAAEDPELAAQLSVQINNTAGEPHPLSTLLLPANFGLPDRFRVTRCMGRGGFGTVYEAYDRERGQSVAVKILREPNADALFRFKQEFRSLITLRHANLIEFHELFEYGQLWVLQHGTGERVFVPSSCQKWRRM